MKLLFENWRKYLLKENEESFEEESEESEETGESGYPSKIARLILSGEDHGAQARALVLALPSVNIGDVLDIYMYEVMKKIKPLVSALLELREASEACYRIPRCLHDLLAKGGDGAKRKSREQHNAGLGTHWNTASARVAEKERHYSELNSDFYEFATLANGGILTFLFPGGPWTHKELIAAHGPAVLIHRLGIGSDNMFLSRDEHRRVIMQLSPDDSRYHQEKWNGSPTDSPAYNFEPANWAEIKRLSEKRQLYERLWERNLEKSEEEGPDETSI